MKAITAVRVPFEGSPCSKKAIRSR